jgi:hypothetical protein
MYGRWLLPLPVVVCLGCVTTALMSQESLAAHIDRVAGPIEVSSGAVRFEYQGVTMLCISDVTYDRMRLVAPIAKREDVEPLQLEIMLSANYHTSLDARYALSEGIVYAAFLHPLSTLDPADLESAIRQVAALARNFGSSYSSDELIFGGRAGHET